jgi:hypothetical protein
MSGVSIRNVDSGMRKERQEYQTSSLSSSMLGTLFCNYMTLCIKFADPEFQWE